MADEAPRNAAPEGKAADQIRKEKGLAHLLAASRYSLQGFLRLCGESAFRHELLGLFVGLVLFVVTGASLGEYLTFAILMLLLFSIEAINTAVEELVDRISPEISTVGRNAKDLGSFSVFCLLVANGLFVAYTVFF